MKLIQHFISLWYSASPKVRRNIIAIFLLLLFFNIFVWIAGVFFSYIHPSLLGFIILAYGLGLRHAVDADHIATIDNTTRKLMNDGKRPVAVGLFFSLGHSTIVIFLSILIAVSASYIKHALPSLQTTGAIIGTSISSFFLLLIGIINLITFLDIARIFRCVTKGGSCREKITHEHIETNGLLAHLFKPFLQTVQNSWNMYFVGFFFGLGFDTASEVGILSISAVSGATGIALWEILLLPLAFTAGMALIDTLDGMLMLGAYGWAYIKPVRKLYYNLNITFVSVVIALFIGGIEALQLLSSQLQLHDSFFELIKAIKLENLGYVIILTFIFSWIISIAVYKVKRYDQI